MVTGESTKDTVKTIVQGMPVDAVYPWLLTRVLFAAHAASGATRIRHSLRPLMISRAVRFQQLGHFVPRERGCMSTLFVRPILRDAACRPLLRMRSSQVAHDQTLMVRRRVSAVSNHEAPDRNSPGSLTFRKRATPPRTGPGPPGRQGDHVQLSNCEGVPSRRQIPAPFRAFGK